MPPAPASRRTAVVLLLLTACLGAISSPTDAAAVRYRWPTPGDIVVGFRAPIDDYAEGHRGVDLAVERGAAVFAMADGEVTFAAAVAGPIWVTVRHADGIRTSVGPLSSVVVSAGDIVTAGQRLGRASGRTHGVVAGLHVGARFGERYVDPRTLVASRVTSLVGDGVTKVVDATPADTGIPTLVPRTPPSPNRLVVVAGLMSSSQQPPFVAADLGYGDGDTEAFSYAGLDADGRPVIYGGEHTWQHVHEAALLLETQLRNAHQRQPGRAADLVGHSLGGLVAMYYLLVLHDPTDPGLPAIGKVVTIASPLQGADLAVAVGIARGDPVLGALLALADAVYDPMSLAAPVLADLRPDSPVVAAVASAYARARSDPFGGPLATGTDLLAIGALLDPVVPAHRTEVGDTATVTVPQTHGGAPRDPGTQEIVTAFLAGRPLPAPSPGQRVAAALRPATVIVSLVEQLLPAVL